MPGYIARRLLQTVPVVLGVTVLVFFMIHLVPGDPARNMLGTRATPEGIEALRSAWGLDRPLMSQYWLFMERLAQGDLGDSLFFQEPSRTLIAERLPVTLLLVAFSTTFAVLIAVPLALLAATKKNGLRDHAVRVIPLVGLGFPSFWIGIMLLLFVALPSDGLLPVGGYGDNLAEHLRAMILPGLAVALGIAPILIRSLRASLLEVLDSDYIITARSKGLPRRRVLVRHGLRNAVISTVSVLGVNIAFLVAGTLVIEQVFALPGIGNLMISAIDQRDFPVVQGVTMVFAFLVVLVYLVTDVVHALLDPRVRLD